MVLQKVGGGEMSEREIVELALNNPLPNVDDLPSRSEYDITQSQLDSQLSDIATTESDIRPVVRGQPSVVSISESSAAMDAVTASQTAIDEMLGSLTGRTALLESPYVINSIWKSNFASEKLFKKFSPTPPHSFSIIESSLVSNQYGNGFALEHDQNGSKGGFIGTGFTFDFTSISTLNVVTDFNPNGNFDDLVIRVGGTQIFSTTSNHSWTERSFDVSEFSGELELEIGHNTSGGNNRSPTSKVSEISFEI